MMAGKIRLTIRGGSRAFEALTGGMQSGNRAENELAGYVRSAYQHDADTVFLGGSAFFKHNGTMQPNRWAHHEALLKTLVSIIMADGNVIVIPSQLDERGDAYADTLFVRVNHPGSKTIEALGSMRADEFHHAGGNVYRIWWD